MSERLRSRIAALRAKYVQTFPEEAAQLRQELDEYLSGGGMEAIRARAHRLAGTSGSYSMDSVFQHAQRLELYCEEESNHIESATRALVICLEEAVKET